METSSVSSEILVAESAVVSHSSATSSAGIALAFGGASPWSIDFASLAWTSVRASQGRPSPVRRLFSFFTWWRVRVGVRGVDRPRDGKARQR